MTTDRPTPDMSLKPGGYGRPSSRYVILDDHALTLGCRECSAHGARVTVARADERAHDAWHDAAEAHTPCDAAGTSCTVSTHDHTSPVDSEGTTLAAPVPMRCNGCGVPSHYAEESGDYWHDSPDAAPCFLAASPAV
jgi:hypothetical protein